MEKENLCILNCPYMKQMQYHWTTTWFKLPALGSVLTENDYHIVILRFKLPLKWTETTTDK